MCAKHDNREENASWNLLSCCSLPRAVSSSRPRLAEAEPQAHLKDDVEMPWCGLQRGAHDDDPSQKALPVDGPNFGAVKSDQLRKEDHGLDLEAVKKKNRMSTEGVSDELRFRGVCIRHLSVDLIDKMTSVGLPLTSKVYEIEESVIRAAGNDMTCPRDQRPCCAYVDAIAGDDHAGRSNFMISYTWGYEVLEIAETLENYCADNDLEINRTYTWICCLCVNQHRVKEQQATGETVPFDAFSKTFADRVRGIGHLVAMMSPWNDPFYLKRVWCNFEMYTAMGEQSCEVTIVMPPKARAEFKDALVHGKGLGEVWAVLGKLDVENAEASISDDRVNIFRMISEGPGFAKLNVAVCKALRSWLVNTCEADIRRHILLGDIDEEHLANLCRKLGTLVRKLGDSTRALDLYQLALKLRQAGGTLETQEGAALMRSIGATKGVARDYEGRMQAYRDAEEILRNSDNLGTSECAVLFDHMGDAARHDNRLDEASAYFLKADHIYTSTDQHESDDRGYLLKNMAEVRQLQGDWNMAQSHYGEALHIMEKNGSKSTPDGALILKGLGDVARHTYRFDDALSLYLQARLIREKTGTMQTPAGSALLLELYIMQGPDSGGGGNESMPLSVMSSVPPPTRASTQDSASTSSRELRLTGTKSAATPGKFLPQSRTVSDLFGKAISTLSKGSDKGSYAEKKSTFSTCSKGSDAEKKSTASADIGPLRLLKRLSSKKVANKDARIV